jgi:phenylalanine ammonia-lyase
MQSPHLVKVHELWKLIRQRSKEQSYELNGELLHIAEVVATSQYVILVCFYTKVIVLTR